MSFNLNRSRSADHALKEKQIDEVIRMYGVEALYLFTERANVDNILNDFSYLQTSKEAKPVYLLPEDTTNFANELTWDIYGPSNNRSVNFYVSRRSLLNLFPEWDTDKGYSGIVNSILVMPNGAFMEITNILDNIDNINNLFLYANKKSVYMITTKHYYHNKADNITVNVPEKEISSVDGVEHAYEQEEDFEAGIQDINEYFVSLDNNKEYQDEEANKTSSVDNVFGSLG